jgi:ABC-type transport system involved in multi-copper enzyme maturation permease subunit
LIVNEKRFGTAAWVMSNPVSRSAFLLAKLVGQGISILVVVVLLPCFVAYLQVSLHSHSAQPVLPFLIAILILCLYLFFYFTFALMLGTMMTTTGPVIGISIALMIGINFLKSALGGFAPKFVQLLPETVLAIAGEVVNTNSLPEGWYSPIVSTMILSLAFLSLAIQRFRREEF